MGGDWWKRISARMVEAAGARRAIWQTPRFVVSRHRVILLKRQRTALYEGVKQKRRKRWTGGVHVEHWRNRSLPQPRLNPVPPRPVQYNTKSSATRFLFTVGGTGTHEWGQFTQRAGQCWTRNEQGRARVWVSGGERCVVKVTMTSGPGAMGQRPACNVALCWKQSSLITTAHARFLTHLPRVAGCTVFVGAHCLMLPSINWWRTHTKRKM